MIDAGEIKTGVEFELMIAGLHVLTELVKGFVMFFLFKVGEFMHNDHP